MTIGTRLGNAGFDRFATTYETLHAENIEITGEEPAYFADYKARLMAHCLSDYEVATILDFGCGLGGSIPFLHQYFPASPLIGADHSAEFLAAAERRHGAIAEFVQTSERISEVADQSCDVVFVACVFHHIAPERHAATLDRLRCCLRPDGHLFLFEHNPYNPLTLHAVNTCPFDVDAVLVRPSEMARRVRKTGYRDVRRRYCTFFPRPLAAFRGLEPMLGWLPLGAQYYIWARP
ncbi:MAG: class I SAM-dependent methyltransferase [Alphaproteobacteria bacterium]|nr:class I SAM-dependent methyltransferase [Alphaproteobacteria bacterium]